MKKVNDPSPKVLEELPESLDFTDGESIQLSCKISNTGADDVVWTKNGRLARKGSRFSVSKSVLN